MGAASAAISGASEVRRAVDFVARTYGADAALLVDSGRSALQIAIAIAVKQQGGDAVVALPAFQCFEVASAAVGADCRIALYDIDPATLGPDLESMESVLRGGVRVIVVAPLYGIPVDWDAVAALAKPYGAIVIEDAAQGHGATWRDQLLGSLGVLSVISFGRGKGWTGGGGGALCARGDFSPRVRALEAGLHRMPSSRRVRVGIVAAAQWVAARPALYGVPAGIPSLQLGETHYHEPTPPARIAAYSAGLLRRTYDASNREAALRRAAAAQWHSELPERVRANTPAVPPHATAGYLRFPVRISATAMSTAVSPSAKRAGVAKSYPISLRALAPIADRLADPARALPGAETLARTLVTLPTHSLMSSRDREAVLSLASEWGNRG
jgi:dTDP-4-amino-4,6-dideoxygalactose transaminase